MQVQLTSYTWLQIPHDIRQELIRIFAIPLTGIRRIEYGAKPTVISDGYTFEDLQTVTVEKMQEFVGSSETDFHILFNLVLDKLNNDKARQEAAELLAEEEKKEAAEKVAKENAVATLVRVGEMAEEVLKPKRGRPAKIKS